MQKLNNSKSSICKFGGNRGKINSAFQALAVYVWCSSHLTKCKTMRRFLFSRGVLVLKRDRPDLWKLGHTQRGRGKHWTKILKMNSDYWAENKCREIVGGTKRRSMLLLFSERIDYSKMEVKRQEQFHSNKVWIYLQVMSGTESRGRDRDHCHMQLWKPLKIQEIVKKHGNNTSKGENVQV